jgi:hypothetical protein
MKVTSQTFSPISFPPTFWPANILLRLRLRQPMQMPPEVGNRKGAQMVHPKAFLPTQMANSP